MNVLVVKDEHVYEVDQKAWCFLRCKSVISRPFIKNKDNQVAKQRGHEDYFRNKPKVDIQGLLEIAKKEEREKNVRSEQTQGHPYTKWSPH